MFRNLLLFIVAFFSTNPVRADTLELAIWTVPAGTQVLPNAGLPALGYAPLTLKYELPNRFFKGTACTQLAPIRVQWVSGAEVAVTICPQVGKRQMSTFARPTGVPGVELDIDFAAQWQALLQQRDAERSQQLALVWGSRVDRRRSFLEQMRAVRCTSTVVGAVVSTS